jgi:hypothetical protein
VPSFADAKPVIDVRFAIISMGLRSFKVSLRSDRPVIGTNKKAIKKNIIVDRFETQLLMDSKKVARFYSSIM